MENYSLDMAKNKLKKYNQEHLLKFYDDLSDTEKEKLINQILKIDFDQILTLYQNSINRKDTPETNISPLSHIDKQTLSEDTLKLYEDLGKKSIQNGEVAVITLAGGQGTRLRS